MNVPNLTKGYDHFPALTKNGQVFRKIREAMLACIINNPIHKYDSRQSHIQKEGAGRLALIVRRLGDIPVRQEWNIEPHEKCLEDYG
jgi:hypothetical protein